MQEKPRDISTFREKLVPHTAHHEKTAPGTLLQFQNQSEMVVRPLNWERAVKRGFFRPKSMEEISVEDYARIAKQSFDELRSYGIEIPVQFVVAQSDKKSEDGRKKEEVFAVVEHIEAVVNLDRVALGQSFADLRRALLEYYKAKFEHQESYLVDLHKQSQYVYGKKKGDALDSLYLVDVEPRVYYGNKMLLDAVSSQVHPIEIEMAAFTAQLAKNKKTLKGFKDLETLVKTASQKEAIDKNKAI